MGLELLYVCIHAHAAVAAAAAATAAAAAAAGPVGETVPFSHFAGRFTFEAIGAGACSVRARPVFRSFLGLTPCLSVWCFLSLRHLSAEAFGGRRTQVRKWRVHCLLDG